MKRISLWAKNHTGPARFLIIAIHIFLNCLAVICGILLNDLGMQFPAAALSVFIIMFFVGIVLYPVKGGKIIAKNVFYARQKSCDLILAASTFLILLFIGNLFDNPVENFSRLNAATATGNTLPGDSIRPYKSILAFNASLKDENGKMLKWKERKKILKHQLKGIRNASDISEGGKVALTILTILVALGLLYVVAALACGLACNGADGAAWLVLIGGTAVVIFLIVVAIRAIYKHRRVREKIAAPPEN